MTDREKTLPLSKRRTAFIKWAAAMVTTLIMLILAEISLQCIIRIRDGKWLYQQLEGSRVPYVKLVNDRRKFTLRPGFTGNRGGLKIDEWGFRQGPFPVGKNSYIVVTAGDSVPFGVAVRNPGTYPYILASLFKEKGLPIDVINAGVPSYNLQQSFDRLRLEVFSRFDLSRVPVITLQAANDVFLLSYYREKWYPGITWADRRFIKKSSLWEKLALVRYVKMALKNVPGPKNPGKDQPSPGAQKKNSPGEENMKKYDRYDGTQMIQHARQVLEEELGFYRDHSIYVILMPIDPFYYQLSGREKNPALKKWQTIKDIADAINELVYRYNDMLIQVSRRFDNTFFFDTRVLMDAQDREEMYADHIHYSPKANRLIAGGLFDFITRHRTLQAWRMFQ